MKHMANKGRILAAAGAFALTIAASPSRAAQLDQPTVVRVYDYAHVPADQLARAQCEATGIYRAAGVPIVWVSGNDAPGATAARSLRVMILSREMSELKIERDAVGEMIVGQASRATGRAYIFYDRVVERAEHYAPTVETMLGWVMAHELGHLLLPESGHSDAGIMRPTFDRHTLVQRFTPAQSRSLRQVHTDAVTIAAQ
jgi:hypothetical protein